MSITSEIKDSPNNKSTDGGEKSRAGADLWKSIQTIIEFQNKTPALENFSCGQENIPMSFNQERLWMLSQLNPHGSAYSIPFVFRICGDLNRSILEKTLQILSKRHESLCITFVEINGKTIQKVDLDSDNAKLLKQVDLSLDDGLDKESAELKFIEEEIRTPFDLNIGPLFRAKLLNISPQNQILILNIHHIIFDGWSEGILLNEISIIYEALCGQDDIPLAPLPIQYTDYSIWQRQCLQGDFLQVLKTYWQNVLNGKLEPLAIPTDFPRPLEPSRGSAVETFYLSETLVSSLKTLARQERATLFQALLAAFKVLLSHYTEQTDLCVCTPMANRNRSELKGLVGYLVNILILRTDLSGSPSFRQLLGRTKQVVSGASAHQDLPVQELATCFDGNQTLLSQVLFALQNTPQNQLKLSGLEVERLEVDNGQADFDLFLSLTDAEGALKGELKYNTDLFQRTTIALMLTRYEQILAAAIANPDEAIDHLLPLTLGERQLLTRMRHHPSMLSPTGSEAESTAHYVAPRNSLEKKLAKIWQDTLNIETIGIHDNFFELGGRSLAAVQLLTQVETIFHQKIPLGKIFQTPTIEKMAALLREKNLNNVAAVEKPTTIVEFKSEGQNPPLFCVHSIEPGILHYINISNYLDRDQPFYGIQPPALSGDDTYIFDSLENMAAYYVNEILIHQPHGPYFLIGHSMGGAIAYEIACQLEQQGQQVAFLGLLDTYAPGYQPLGKKRISPSLAYQIYTHLFNLSRVEFRRKIGYILERIKDKIPQSIWNKIDKSAFLIYDQLQPNELSEIYKNLPIYKTLKKAHYRAYHSYSPSYHYQGPLTLFRAIERPTNLHYVPCLGWRQVAPQLKIDETPGHHNSMVHEPNVQTLARQLQESLRSCFKS